MNISYKGTDFHGWQTQPDALTVQETISQALTTLLQNKTDIVGCGRTDSGVHARYFVLHFEHICEVDYNLLQFKLNCFLPKSISVQKIYEVTLDAHARFSATFRTYQYIISRHKNPFLQNLAYQYTKPLQIEEMNKAANLLLLHKDFTSFSKLHTDTKNNICSVTHAQWETTDEQYIFTITANRFLRNMVRAIVGTMLMVGKEKCSTKEFEQIILSKDRGKAGSSAPAEGLYLTHVAYPHNIKIDK